MPRPIKELKDFKKIFIEPGETKEIEFNITFDKLAFYDDRKHHWIAEIGEYEALIGSSSSDIRESIRFYFKNHFILKK